MEILEKFHLFVGSDEYCNVKQYIEKHNLQNELNNIIQENDKDKLFDFAFRYGLVSIVKFLYEELNQTQNAFEFRC